MTDDTFSFIRKWCLFIAGRGRTAMRGIRDKHDKSIPHLLSFASISMPQRVQNVARIQTLLRSQYVLGIHADVFFDIARYNVCTCSILLEFNLCLD